MPNYELDNQLKTLSGYVYKAKGATRPKDWIDIKSSENKKTGFYDKYSELGNTVLKGSVEYNDTKQFTREDIAKMTPEEYQKNESAIMAQMKESGIPTKAQANAKTKTSANSNASKSGGNSKASSGSASGDGNWVTINGHHVLLD